VNLITLFEKMRDYQAEQLMKECDKPIPDSVRLLKDEDIDRYYTFFLFLLLEHNISAHALLCKELSVYTCRPRLRRVL
jgi:hypothetical protein